MTKARDIASATPAPSTVSATELGYLDGVSSAVQTQLDAKEATLPSQTGNSGKYLTTNGSAKSWGTVSAGGMTLLSTTTLSGASTSISITPTGYTALMISVEGPDLAADDGFTMNINNDSKSNLALVRYDSIAASVSGSKNGVVNFNNGTDMDSSTHMAAGVLWIYNPTSTTVAKTIDIRTSWLDGTGGTNWASYIGGGAYTGSSVASINFACFASSFSGGSVLVYGVK